MRNYRDLEVWDKSHKLTLRLYERSRTFPKEEFYGLTSQLRRAAMSIGANLAEGCGRQTTPELARYVRIAIGSASELDYHLLLAHDSEFLESDEHHDLSEELTRIRKMLTALLSRLEGGTKVRAAGTGGRNIKSYVQHLRIWANPSGQKPIAESRKPTKPKVHGLNCICRRKQFRVSFN